MSNDINTGNVFNVGEAQGKDRVALETTAAEAQMEAPTSQIAREVEENAEHVHEAAELAAKTAQHKGPQITEGQRDVEAAKETGSGYIQQVKDLAGSAVSAAQSAANTTFETGKTYIASAQKVAEPYIENAKGMAQNSLGTAGVQGTQGTSAASTGIPTTSAPLESGSIWWLLPLGGGLTLYFAPKRQSLSHSIFASSSVIPCPPSKTAELEPIILSPSEHDLTMLGRITSFLREKIWEPILTGKRFVYLFFLFVPIIICSPMLLVGKPEKKYRGDRWGAVWWYDFLVSKMEAAGPTFIKLAQWAASRADLFPSLLCERLGSLHSQGKPHSLEYTKGVIARVFQRPFDEVFEEFNETPIGTGAIAQVYKATLRKDLIPPSYLGPRRPKKKVADTIRPAILQDPPPSVPTASVAVKILHPKVQNMIARDLRIMGFFAEVISMLPGMQWLSLPQEVEVFGKMMNQQIDMRNEAENLVTFENNFSTRKVPVTFPRPLQSYSTHDILVEEYENAVPLEAFLRNGGGPYDDQVATLGLDAFLNMLLLDNFVHSDLHPGNILIKFTKPPSTKELLYSLYNSLFHRNEASNNPYIITAESKESKDSDQIASRLRALILFPAKWRAELENLSKEGYIPEIVFIDAGLVTVLNATNRKNFLDLFRAVAEFDGYRTGQLMIERSRTPETAIDPETFALKMQHLVLSVKRKTFSLGQIKISDLLTEVLRAVRVHHVKMEGDFINTVISILLLEGIGRRLDPDLDLFASSLPILRQLGGQMATRETINKNLPSSNLGALLKVWVYIEARSFISSAVVNADDLVKYDLLTPSV